MLLHKDIDSTITKGVTTNLRDWNLKNKIEKAILDQDKERLQDLINKITKEFPDKFIIELTLLKWKENKWDGKKWSLDRGLQTCPACKKFAMILNKCTKLCPIARVEKERCLGSIFYDDTRSGDKKLMIERIEAALKLIS